MSKDEFGRELIPCRLCGEDTPMLGTKLCDRCWELETRIHGDPTIAEHILKTMKKENLNE